MGHIDPDKLLTVEEAAELLGVKPGTLYAWASRGVVPRRKVGACLRFHRGELLDWTAGRTEDKQPRRRPKLRVVQ
jgi:excisionase family DNA binding protein